MATTKTPTTFTQRCRRIVNHPFQRESAVPALIPQRTFDIALEHTRQSGRRRSFSPGEQSENDAPEGSTVQRDHARLSDPQRVTEKMGQAVGCLRTGRPPKLRQEERTRDRRRKPRKNRFGWIGSGIARSWRQPNLPTAIVQSLPRRRGPAFRFASWALPTGVNWQKAWRAVRSRLDVN